MGEAKVPAEHVPRFSLVLEAPSPPPPQEAYEHLRSKLRFETDPADVYADLQKGTGGVRDH